MTTPTLLIHPEDRGFLQKTCHRLNLSMVYLWQSIVLWVRLHRKRPRFRERQTRQALLHQCIDLAVRWLGPQDLVDAMPAGPHVRHLYMQLFGNNAPRKNVKRNLQIRVFLELLDRRI